MEWEERWQVKFFPRHKSGYDDIKFRDGLESAAWEAEVRAKLYPSAEQHRHFWYGINSRLRLDRHLDKVVRNASHKVTLFYAE